MKMKFLHKILIQLAFCLIAISCCGFINAQSTSQFIDNFNEDTLSQYWNTTGKSTFVLADKDSVLNVAYNRTDSSTAWDQFYLSGISVNINNNTPNLTIAVKSNLLFPFNIKPCNSGTGYDWFSVTIPGDNKWHTYNFVLKNSLGLPITSVYFYFDGGATKIESGNVEIDNFGLGVSVPANTSMLSEVNTNAGLLKNYIVEGTGEGQFPSGSKTKLQSVIAFSDSILANSISFTQGYIDTVSNALFDSITNVEKSVNIAVRPLIDSLATFQTVNLYKNLRYIASKHHYLFGQQDATAYGNGNNGAGWTDPGSGDTSDVKMITGSNPALLSQNANWIIGSTFQNLSFYINRQVVCYNNGGVNSICWHMADPVYGQFNYASLGTPYNVVASILPHGTYYSWYKNNLKFLALYLKSLRGSHGETVPIILRLFHEQNGGWFWWGAGHCSVAQYDSLWVNTIQYLRDSCDLHSLIIANSPNSGDGYKTMFPDKKYIDIYGLDDYPPDGTLATREAFTASIVQVVNYAAADNKVAALTEFGDFTNELGIPGFWNKMVLDGIYADTIAARIAYLATWQNYNTTPVNGGGGFYTPYPGIPGASTKIPDFLNFYDDTTTIFLNDMLPIYNNLLTGAVQKPSQGCWFHYFELDSIFGSVDYWQPGRKTYRIVVDIPDNPVKNNLTPIFLASPGSVVQVNGRTQKSAADTMSFKDSVQFVVISQNQQDTAVYNVSTTLVSEYATNNKIINSNVLVYPNPANDYFVIQTDNPIQQVDIYKSSGIKLLTFNNYNSGQKISTNSLNDGVYLVKITFADNSVVSKFMIIQGK